MPIYKAPIEDVNFLLDDVFQIAKNGRLTRLASIVPATDAGFARRSGRAVSGPRHASVNKPAM